MLPGSGRTSLLGSCLSTYNLRYSGLLGLCVLSPRPRASARRSCMPPLDLYRETQQQSKYFFASSFPNESEKVEKKTKKSPKLFEQSWGVQECSKSWDKICEKICSSPTASFFSPSCNGAGLWNEILLSQGFCKCVSVCFNGTPLMKPTGTHSAEPL